MPYRSPDDDTIADLRIELRQTQAELGRAQQRRRATEESWRKDGLRMAKEIEQYRLALRYITGEDIPGWEPHQRPEDVAADALIGAPNLASAEA